MDTKRQGDAKAELDSILRYAMDSAHQVFARLWELQKLTGASYDPDSTAKSLADAGIIAEHLLARHKAECDRALERVQELNARVPKRLVG